MYVFFYKLVSDKNKAAIVFTVASIKEALRPCYITVYTYYLGF